MDTNKALMVVQWLAQKKGLFLLLNNKVSFCIHAYILCMWFCLFQHEKHVLFMLLFVSWLICPQAQQNPVSGQLQWELLDSGQQSSAECLCFDLNTLNISKCEIILRLMANFKNSTVTCLSRNNTRWKGLYITLSNRERCARKEMFLIV